MGAPELGALGAETKYLFAVLIRWVDGSVAGNYVPCSPNGDGDCCSSGDFCTSLGYCISNSKGYHYRGACTDDSWGNPSCPDYCLANTNSGNSSAVNLIACNAASSSGSWCCAYNGSCCSNSTNTYVPSFGTIFAEPGTSSTSSGSSTASTSSASSTSSSSSASIASTSATTTPTSSAAAKGTMTGNESKSNTGTVVGAAVGIPLGLAAIAGLLLFWKERNKRKHLEQEIPEKNINPFAGFSPTQPGYGGQGQKGYGQVQQGGDARPTKTYEMNTERTVELPAGYGQHELANPDYDGHGQQGVFREGMRGVMH
ncbi:uncharacterized protein PAC_17689 [Phialocephala subalpina]|uniref:Mid2 domain-containing protein n=1 Tax=Phialocephala subalpina TaxID=576137 RepID=A0A1L7XRX8_9HELO|nr:uncharacterized protein PAC_17689 [Phialocephala subalpina]